MVDHTQNLTTWLFVTAIDEEQINTAANSGADVVIVDLEDFTPPQLRAAGRDRLNETLSVIAKAGPMTCVRINPMGSADHHPDLIAALDSGVQIISLPKTTSADELHDLANAMDAHLAGARERPSLLPCIETAEGLVNTYSILKNSPPLLGCLVASEDMTASLGAPRDRSGKAIRYARERFLMECRAAGVEPVDCPYTWADRDGLIAETEDAKALGYHCKSAARAEQIADIREKLEPSVAEISAAEKVVKAFEDAQAAGQDRVEVDGHIVEQPSYLNAKALLTRRKTHPSPNLSPVAN